jgi:hypothetical protein
MVEPRNILGVGPKPREPNGLNHRTETGSAVGFKATRSPTMDIVIRVS